MKELNLAIYTGDKGDNKVTMTATFETHEDAVKFHEGVARLCKDSSPSIKDHGYSSLLPKLIGRN
jgi:hypothetical protein